VTYCFYVFSAIYRGHLSDVVAGEKMSKKLLFISLRMSEDLKKRIEKKVASRQRKNPWGTQSEAAFIREAIMFYLDYEGSKKDASESKATSDL